MPCYNSKLQSLVGIGRSIWEDNIKMSADVLTGWRCFRLWPDDRILWICWRNFRITKAGLFF